jgi:CRP-like cAMP-binding protein
LFELAAFFVVLMWLQVMNVGRADRLRGQVVMVDVSELKKYEVFSAFSDKQLEQLAMITERITCKVDSHFYEDGDWANFLFVLSKGLVSLQEYRTGDQKGVAFEIRESGELFGAACLMTPQHHTMTGVCLEDSEVLAIDADELLALRQADAEMDHRFMKAVALLYFERYMATKRQLHEMTKTPTIGTALPG